MTTTPTVEDQNRRAALLDAILQYRTGSEAEPVSWWFAEIIADLGHLWNELDLDATPAGFLDAVAHGVRICDRETAAARAATC
jgi:hypothetical protein